MALRSYEISLLVLKNISQMSRRASEIVQQEKRNFVSSCGHVMSSVHYFKQMIPLPPFFGKVRTRGKRFKTITLPYRYRRFLQMMVYCRRYLLLGYLKTPWAPLGKTLVGEVAEGNLMPCMVHRHL